MLGPLDDLTRRDIFARLAAAERAGLPAAGVFSGLPLPASAKARRTRLAQRLQQGWDIPRALRESGFVRPDELAMIEVACQYGGLDAVYARLHARLAVRVARSRALKARLMMPVALLTMALVIQPLPALVTGSRTLAEVVLTLVQLAASIALLVWLLRRLRNYSDRPAHAGRSRLFDGLLLSLPLVGPAILARNARNFAESLGDLLDAGVPMFDALPLARNLIGNRVLAEHALQLEQAVRNGAPFAQASLLMPGEPFARLSSVAHAGECAGSLGSSLIQHARLEDEEIGRTNETITTWIPRIAYALVLALMAASLIRSNPFMPGID